MKNTNTILCAAMLLCVSACNNGTLYYPVNEGALNQIPLYPAGTTGNTNDTNITNPVNTDLSQTPLQAPQFQPTIDGNVFVPRAVFYATGQDPQNQPVLLLVVSDQNDLCAQVTQAHQMTPGGSQLAMYLYDVEAVAGAPAFAPPPATGGTYAVFDSTIPSADVSANPSFNIPTDAGDYASGYFFTYNPLCGKTHLYQLSEGAVDVTVVDAAHTKASGDIQVLLDDSVTLNAGGSFVAQACPALLHVPAALKSCMLP